MKENNILLASFLNRNYEDDLNMIWEDLYTNGLRNPEVMDNVENYRYFHNDWNWLMLVVEKIETLPMQPEFFVMYDNREEFKGWYWNISVRKLFNKDCLNRESTKIIAYYNACIEFVKWYNDNK